MPGPYAGHYLDGRTAARRAATIRLLGRLLQVDLEDGHTLIWPVSEVRQTQGAYAGEQVRLERGADVPEVLLVSDAALLRELRAVGGARSVRDPANRRTRLLLTVLAAFAVVGLVAALYRWGIPAAVNIAADRVPRSWEARLGEAIVDQVAPVDRRCTDPRREALIASIVERLRSTRRDNRYTFRITIVNDRQINAMAAPGGSIVVLRGLLERSRTPEQLAGVLAHEMAHVMRRHTTRAILAHVSTGLLLAAVAGDVTTAAAFGVEGARTLAALAYSRSSEEEADADGVRMLLAASIDPRGMIEFFDSMRGRDEGPGIVRYLSTHPSSGDRAERLRGIVARTPHQVAPLLPDQDWQDVVRICRS